MFISISSSCQLNVVGVPYHCSTKGKRGRSSAAGVLMAVALTLELTDAPSTYGSVRDFIDVYTPQWRDTLPWGSHFPTFNVADSCISVGAVLLLLTGFGDQEKDEAEEIDTASPKA